MRVLILYGSLDSGILRTCAWIERVAAALSITPLFAQCTDPQAAQELAAVAGYRILPLDDAAVGLAARLSPYMERPLTTADAALLQNKWGQRSAFARHGVPSPPFASVETVADVLDCGRRWGYPLMLKPARGTRSQGVRRIDGPDGIAEGLAAARDAARTAGSPRILAEGYLDGPDVAVESFVLDGVTRHVSFWQSGWRDSVWQAGAPVGPALRPHLATIGEVVARANEALGLRWAATSNEIRLTADGPAVVEVNARLGLGPCEEAILLHAGIDRVRGMLVMLCGGRPDLAPRERRAVAQIVMRPKARGHVRAVALPSYRGDDPAVSVELQLAPGTRIDDAATSFIGWLLAEGRPGEDADGLLPRAAAYAQQVRELVELD